MRLGILLSCSECHACILQTGMVFVGRDALGAPGRHALRTAEIYDRFKYISEYRADGGKRGIAPFLRPTHTLRYAASLRRGLARALRGAHTVFVTPQSLAPRLFIGDYFEEKLKKNWRVSELVDKDRHPGLDPGSPSFAKVWGLRVKPAMT